MCHKLHFGHASYRMKGFILQDKAAEMTFLRDRFEKSPRSKKPGNTNQREALPALRCIPQDEV